MKSIQTAALYGRVSTQDKGQEVENQLAQLREYFPTLRVETHGIKKVAAMRLNEALSE